MGLIYDDAKRLWQARLAGESFESVVTCSHLQLFLHPDQLRDLRQSHRREHRNKIEVPLANYKFGAYSDQFCIQFLGAKRLETLDYSAYEGATIVHDMNLPIPESLHGQFDAVIEAGSLEHIFNFPVAIQNLMSMVRVGGNVFLTTLANNFCGHGFYQFSPELIYRIFSPENGFKTTNVQFLEATFPSVELAPIRAAYKVADPVIVHSRVGLVCDRPILMVVDAKKISDVKPFARPPQQSDYVTAWESKTPTQSSDNSAVKKMVKRVYRSLPSEWQQKIQGHRIKSEYSFNNQTYYRKLS